MDCKITEKQVEAYLVKQVKALGGKAYKFVSPGNDGVPDRLVCLPGGRVFFVETKSPGEKPNSKQRARHRELRAMGFNVFGCVDSKEDVGAFIEYCTSFAGIPRDVAVEMEFYDHE